jgi:hypothetical protein
VSQLGDFLEQGLQGQEMSCQSLRPVTLVINEQTITGGGGTWREIPVKMRAEGSSWQSGFVCASWSRI